MSDLDCVVIGAGPAGIAAGSLLRDAGRSYVILEARDRIGGRTHSVSLSDGTPLEEGGQAIHGSRLVTWEYVIRTGVRTHGCVSPDEGPVMVLDGDTWRRVEEDPEIAAAWEHVETVWIQPEYDSIGAFDALESSGFTDRQVAAVRKQIQYLMSVYSDEASARAVAEAAQQVRPVNGAFYWIEDGYSELWRRVTAPFADRIHLESPVIAVDWSPDGVVVHTPSREFVAATAIVTLPVGVLAAGAVEFRPALPDQKLEAIGGIRMKPTGKLTFEFQRPFWEADVGDAARFNGASSDFEWWVPFAERPGPAALTWMGGGQPGPWEKSRTEPGSLEASALADLADLFPTVDVRSELVQTIFADWPGDPWARGRTSIAVLGGAHLRSQLAAPTPPLFWAGEASRSDGSARTVHGALLSGRTAVVEAMHQLRPFSLDDESSRIDWSRFPE